MKSVFSQEGAFPLAVSGDPEYLLGRRIPAKLHVPDKGEGGCGGLTPTARIDVQVTRKDLPHHARKTLAIRIGVPLPKRPEQNQRSTS